MEIGGGQPAIERVLPQAGPLRWVSVAGWTALPFVRLALFSLLAAAAGLATDAGTLAGSRLPGAVLNAYILLVVLVGMRPLAEKLAAVAALGDEATERRGRLNGSLVIPLALALAMTMLTEASQLIDFGWSAIAANPLPFLVAFALAFLIRLPQASAFWLSVVALLVIADLGRRPPPKTFPEDRSLGLKAVGELLTTILVLYVIVYIPIFLLGSARITDFAVTLGVFLLGLAAMLVAVWRIHLRMAAERSAQVAAAADRYAQAYRLAATDPDPAAGQALQTARLLLDGASSIHEWPFDERTQRILGLLLTSVLTGVVVRVVMLVLGI